MTADTVRYSKPVLPRTSAASNKGQKPQVLWGIRDFEWAQSSSDEGAHSDGVDLVKEFSCGKDWDEATSS
jgi:hypothetical protein